MPIRWLAWFGLLVSAWACGGEQRIADLGDLKLSSGEVLRATRLGYRTDGDLNAERSNAVVLLSWFGARSEQLQPLIGAGKLVDSERYFVISIDALADGVSSSPSNHPEQARMAFPVITIADMVNASRRLLSETFQLKHVHALIGVSMGGMQVTEWIVAEPTFADKAVIIHGSPRLAPYDLLLWQSTMEAIRRDPTWQNGNYRQQPARRALYYIGVLAGMTPAAVNRQFTRAQVSAILTDSSLVEGFDANDHLRQAEALLTHDVARHFGSDLRRAAAQVKIPVLIAVHADDHVLSPAPMREFASGLGAATVIELGGDCGHGAFQCESDGLNRQVAAFLAAP